jgi:hypothetical protein
MHTAQSHRLPLLFCLSVFSHTQMFFSLFLRVELSEIERDLRVVLLKIKFASIFPCAVRLL